MVEQRPSSGGPGPPEEGRCSAGVTDERLYGLARAIHEPEFRTCLHDLGPPAPLWVALGGRTGANVDADRGVGPHGSPGEHGEQDAVEVPFARSSFGQVPFQVIRTWSDRRARPNYEDRGNGVERPAVAEESPGAGPPVDDPA